MCGTDPGEHLSLIHELSMKSFWEIRPFRLPFPVKIPVPYHQSTLPRGLEARPVGNRSNLHIWIPYLSLHRRNNPVCSPQWLTRKRSSSGCSVRTICKGMGGAAPLFAWRKGIGRLANRWCHEYQIQEAFTTPTTAARQEKYAKETDAGWKVVPRSKRRREEKNKVGEELHKLSIPT